MHTRILPLAGAVASEQALSVQCSVYSGLVTIPTPTSWRDGEEPSPHMQATCPQHGIIAMGPRGLVLEQAAAHFAHDHQQQVVVEGEDFVLENAPYRCDICGTVAEPPWWTWTINPPLFEFGDADGRWLVCSPCDPLLRAKDLKGLLIRAVREQRMQTPDLPREIIYQATRPRLELLVEAAEPERYDSSYK